MGPAVACVLAVLLGSHVALVVGLARRGRRVRAAVALLVPPLAPWWGWGAGMRRVAVVWIGAVVLYAAAVAAMA